MHTHERDFFLLRNTKWLSHPTSHCFGVCVPFAVSCLLCALILSDGKAQMQSSHFETDKIGADMKKCLLTYTVHTPITHIYKYTYIAQFIFGY